MLLLFREDKETDYYVMFVGGMECGNSGKGGALVLGAASA